MNPLNNDTKLTPYQFDCQTQSMLIIYVEEARCLLEKNGKQSVILYNMTCELNFVPITLTASASIQRFLVNLFKLLSSYLCDRFTPNQNVRGS